MEKKANLGLIVVIIILILVIGGLLLMSWASRECKSNKECPATAYCGSDFKCHEFPNQVVVTENKYLAAALVLGVAILASAFIFRGKKIRIEEPKE